MEMPGGFVALAPILKSPLLPCQGPGWWWVESTFSLALWVCNAASGWRTGDICVDAQVKQPALHPANMLFLPLFQLAVFRDTFDDPGDLHLSQVLPPPEAKGTTRHRVLLLLSESAATEIPEGPNANSSPEPVEPVSRKAAGQMCFPGRLIKIGHDHTPVPFCGWPPSVKARVKPIHSQSSDTLVQTPLTDLNLFPFQFSYFPFKILLYQNQF